MLAWTLTAGAVAAALIRVSGSPATSGTPLVVMALNLRLDGAQAESIVEIVREARVDVLALQEFTPDTTIGRSSSR